MILYTIIFYISFIYIFQNFLDNSIVNYSLLFFLTLIFSYILNRVFGNPILKVESFFKTEYKTLYGFSFIFLPEIIILIVTIFVVLFFK